MMTAMPNSHHKGHRKAIKEDGNQGIPGKETWRTKCEQQI